MEEYFVGATEASAEAVRAAATRRLAGEPLQYVLGHWPFRDLDLDVDPRVLIPRPETEELVTIALDELRLGGASTPLVVDLGCGSGAIALAIFDELTRRGVRASVVAVDRSSEALLVARANARRHRATGVAFVESSWFDGLDPSLRGRIDLVVTNPPYVGRRELAALDPVLRYEPFMALVAEDSRGVEGFADVEHLIKTARDWLAPRGALVLEHGELQGGAASRVAHDSGYSGVFDHRDLAGRPRVLVARR